MAPDDDEPRVKDLLGDTSLEEIVDEATRRELEKWFGLPSFTQLAEDNRPPPEADDPEMVAARERRDKALAEVDPALLERIRFRTEINPETLLELDFVLDVHVDPTIARFDMAMAERLAQIAEPREVEISEELRDDMKERAPQALLRDLHRPELDFEKTFEVVDMAAEQRLDIVAEVDAAMKASWKLPPLTRPVAEAHALVDELRRERHRPWPELFKSLPLVNRKIQE